MTAKSTQKRDNRSKDRVNFSLRQALKPLIKSFTEACEARSLILHFDIPVHIPDTLTGDPQNLRNRLSKKFSAFLKKALETSADEIIHAGIQMEKKRDERGNEQATLTFVFEILADASGTEETWVNDHCSFIFDVDLFTDASALSSPYAVDLHHLSCLVFTTPALYSSLTAILESWKMPLKVLTEIPDELPDHDMIFITDRVGKLSGFDVTRKIRKKAPKTPIVLVSSHPQRGDAAQCRELGIQSYLSYPLQPIDLWEAVKQVVQSPRSRSFSDLITKHSLREEEARLNILLIPSGSMDVAELSEIGSLLLSHGHRITMVMSPEEMKKLPFSGKFDLIVTDADRKDQLRNVSTPIVTFDPDVSLEDPRLLLEKIEHLN